MLNSFKETGIFDYELRVRYAETDQMGVTYYGNYLVWFEVARTEYFRTLGIDYSALEKKGLYLVVAEAWCRYYSPTCYDDLISVRTCISEINRSSLKFLYRVYKKGEEKLVAEGYSTHVFVDESMKPVKMPSEINERIKISSF